MLISSFIIDLFMAIVFVLTFKNISERFRTTIGLLKLFGDCSAMLSYMNNSPIIIVIGVIVLLLNLYYVINSAYYCIKKKHP